ncbi:MAG: phosphopantothenate--cysteine ligase [Clostridiales Family XIII bacterium]|jgi:phosphopantothenate-cysteine ligase|nr:phosphopantothenate--cysteine ligase [Clostridiales Family XIII bacterium]
MNILITAGGTGEKIDRVRSITNMSTGRLSRVVAETLAASDETERILYVCGERAVRPNCEKAEILPIGSAAELAETVAALCRNRRVDAIVHAMAVGDYTVRAVSTRDALVESALSRLGAPGAPKPAEDVASARSLLRDALASAEAFPRDGKIPSDVEDLVIFLQRTPKIISTLRDLAPGAVIVGFKLLDGVTEAQLIDTAHALLLRNDCDFVLANDLRKIEGDAHVGHLVGRDGAYVTYNDKEEIARGLAEAIFRGRKQGGKA